MCAAPVVRCVGAELGGCPAPAGVPAAGWGALSGTPSACEARPPDRYPTEESALPGPRLRRHLMLLPTQLVPPPLPRSSPSPLLSSGGDFLLLFLSVRLSVDPGSAEAQTDGVGGGVPGGAPSLPCLGRGALGLGSGAPL